MRSINKTTILGNIGADVEVRQMNNGVSVANLSVATSESWKDRNTGEVIERTEWHRVVLFGKLAEIAGQYLGKGSKVYIEGRMQTREWEKDGIKRYTTEIIVDQRGSMVMLDKPEQGQQPAAQQAAPQPARQRPAPQPAPAQADAENWDAYDPLPY